MIQIRGLHESLMRLRWIDTNQIPIEYTHWFQIEVPGNYNAKPNQMLSRMPRFILLLHSAASSGGSCAMAKTRICAVEPNLVVRCLGFEYGMKWMMQIFDRSKRCRT